MAAAIADKQQWVADQAAAGVFKGLAKDARWQDYADRLISAESQRNNVRRGSRRGGRARDRSRRLL